MPSWRLASPQPALRRLSTCCATWCRYLEMALGERPGKSSRVRLNNDTRRAFKSLFAKRRCVTLVRCASLEPVVPMGRPALAA